MSNIKSYDIDYDWKCGLVIEVDHDIITEDILHEINDFWSDSKYRLSQNQGNILFTVLKMIAREAFHISLTNNYSTFGVVCEFDWDQGNGVEGYPAMNGTSGFKIIHVETDLFDYSDMTVKEEKKC